MKEVVIELDHEQERRTNRYLEKVFSSMQTTLVVTDSQGLIQTVNRALLELLGYTEEELLGRPLSAICTSAELPGAASPEAAMHSESLALVRVETRYRSRDGRLIPMLGARSALRDEEGGLEGVICIAFDLTERKEFVAQIFQSEKLASIGQLAAGIAHEINNPLGFIFSNLGTLAEYSRDILGLVQGYENLYQALETGDADQIAQARLQVGSCRAEVDVDYLIADLGQLICESREGAERVRHIVQSLREFAHLDQTEKTPASLNQCVESALTIAWNELKYKVQVEKEYATLPQVPCYPQELNQVFINLLINAAQAIADQGVISIRTFQEGHWVCAAIADTGQGMSPEVRRRIFEPFFTTKPVGQGTGLGLSTSYHIVVHKHGGELLVDSQEGVGTTFTVRIPLNGAGESPPR
ncbi:MAG: PAS domain S-box protein [Candidatus Latescibacteria bacterium]|nr:PAS domain S-box protein [Candidatus Latescibacterota bacterium]